MRAPRCPSERGRRVGAASLLALAVLLSAAFAGAAGSAAEPAAFDFRLPTLEGDRFLGPADFRGPVLVNVWGRDCPPCVAELPLLQRFALDHPQWTVLLVATDAPQDARRFLAERGIALPTVRGGPSIAALMRRAGHRSGALPFNLVVRDGRLCAARPAALAPSDLAQWQAACGAP